MNTIYQERLLDHYRYPHNKGTLTHYNFACHEFNPSCGDRISMHGVIANDHIHAIAFEGSGCVISLATASLLTDAVLTTMPLDDILALDHDYILALVGIALGPTRLKCALLPLHALQEGVRVYQKEHTAC